LTNYFFENGIERIDITVTDTLCNYSDFVIGVSKQRTAPLDATILQIGTEGLAGMPHEHALQMSTAPL
jgi:hypothetical protein